MRAWTGVIGAVALAAAALLPGAAQAYWRGGVWFGFGVPLYPPPVYPAPLYPVPAYPVPGYPVPAYPPPYYGPRPYAYAPPAYYPAPPAAGGCYAGPYVCPLQAPSAVGAPCACPTRGGTVWGQAR